MIAGAKAEAMTLLDLFLKPQLVDDAWTYFRDEQGMKMEYKPMVTDTDKPAIYLNTEIQAEFRPALEKFYYDESKFDSYLEQLGITYPTIKISDKN